MFSMSIIVCMITAAILRYNSIIQMKLSNEESVSHGYKLMGSANL